MSVAHRLDRAHVDEPPALAEGVGLGLGQLAGHSPSLRDLAFGSGIAH
jgi:hypothetical protein